jgi:hypothetical protein
MNVFLLYPTQNFILQKEFSLHEETLFKDLDLETICQTMADNDPILFATAKTALLTTVPSIETIH